MSVKKEEDNFFKNVDLEEELIVFEVSSIPQKNNKKEKTNTPTDKKDKFQTLSTERLEWSQRIINLSKRFDDVQELAKVQIDLFTYRQMLVEKRASVNSVLFNIAKKIRINKATSFEDVKLKNQIKTKSYQETETLIDFQIKDVLEEKEQFENHKEFIEGSIKTLDGMAFAISNRIKLQEFFL